MPCLSNSVAKFFGASELLEEQVELNKKEPSLSIQEYFPEGILHDDEEGQVFIRKVKFTPEKPIHERGYYAPVFKSIPFADPDTIRRLARDEEADVDLEGWAFLDIETTGLSGGTGTYPFLIGLGFFENSSFIVEQYFMPDYPDEIPMMRRLMKRFADFDGVVTYNGKSFDVPLLQTRFIYNRIPSPLAKPHWDLLHGARRLWKRSLPNCSLGTIEHHILGHPEREHDIHGSEIPQVYFDYAREKNRERMKLVFDHHAQDIASLASLALRMAEYYHDPSHAELQQPNIQFGLAGVFELCHQSEKATSCLENAIFLERNPDQIHLLSMHLSRRYKKQERWAEAVEIWEAQVNSTKFYSVEPHIELAKYYEHRAKEHEKAKNIVLRALKWIESHTELQQYAEDLPPESTKGKSPEIDALMHRLDRLKRKLG